MGSKMDSKDEQIRSYTINDDADVLPMDQLDPTGVLVKPKWRGTSDDQMDMEVLGRHQVLRVTNIIIVALQQNSTDSVAAQFSLLVHAWFRKHFDLHLGNPALVRRVH